MKLCLKFRESRRHSAALGWKFGRSRISLVEPLTLRRYSALSQRDTVATSLVHRRYVLATPRRCANATPSMKYRYAINTQSQRLATPRRYTTHPKRHRCAMLRTTFLSCLTQRITQRAFIKSDMKFINKSDHNSHHS